MKTVSKEGGIKDASVDRLSEMMVAQLIAKELGFSDDMKNKILISFQLSTLTKAACEMSSVITSEGGAGGMIERRITLFKMLQELIILNKLPKKNEWIREKLINDIKRRIYKLVSVSIEEAKKRINALAVADNVRYIHPPNNPNLSGASEARKYAAIVLINNRMGVDIVKELNSLSEGQVIFPTAELLIENYMYIARSMEKAQKFLNEALRIAGFKE